MNDFAQAGFDPASSPQVRTLLLTDLCESTLLVERLGDKPAAELFRAHDRLVLELQQRWRGRLIDRSDGLLLLFERPVDGLGFALDYARGLRELGDRPEVRDRKLLLQARAGLHVGEVLTWLNSEAAVQAGAKPLEVEGLAKPLAGRLMTLARPGQILLSATAEPLARRASRELGERSEHLIWKSHGRWRFKGVPDGQEVFEVGEPGYAPLRAPKQNGGKAWRDIPVWRRPTALAAEVFLVAGLATGAWFLTRPTPAIAFNERDWVVVGDLRNLTGQPVLDESLEQAFRISLEQSRYVNVLSDLKVRDTLTLMKRGPATTLDRETASEIAIRDGARAVILPTVAEVGGRVRVSAEVIDPHTQTTVYAESFDGVGAGSTLASIDEVTGELREKLGEAIASIEQTSAPLPNVSTANLDALKAYALGIKAHHQFKAKEALSYFQRATELDPNFALAYVAAGRTYGSVGDIPNIRKQFDLANKHRLHLAPREQLTLDAQIARFDAVEPMLQRWRQLVDMYPDNQDAHMVLAIELMLRANDFRDGLEHARAASTPQFQFRNTAVNLQGILLTGMERFDEAIKTFEGARRSGFAGASFDYARAYAAQRKYDKASQVLQGHGKPGSDGDLRVPLHDLLLAIDQGQWRAAEAAASAGSATAAKNEPLFSGVEWQLHRISASAMAGDGRKSLEQKLRAVLARIESNAGQSDAVSANFDEVAALSVGYVAAQAGLRDIVGDTLGYVDRAQDIKGYPLTVQLREVILAERDRLDDKAGTAVERLTKIVNGDSTLVVAHAALMRAAQQAGDTRLALREAEWVAKHRGRAYSEWGAEGLLTPWNVAETDRALLVKAELERKVGNAPEAERAMAAFLSAWPKAGLPRALSERVARAQVHSP